MKVLEQVLVDGEGVLPRHKLKLTEIQWLSSTVRTVPKTKFHKEGSRILFLVSAGQKPGTRNYFS
jgi:hypothetical protein